MAAALFRMLCAPDGPLPPHPALDRRARRCDHGHRLVRIPGHPARLQRPDYKGAEIFANQRCGGCHTLNVAGTQGSRQRAHARAQGRPELRPAQGAGADILYAMRNGGLLRADMPQNIVDGRDAERVARFVAKYSGEGQAPQATRRRPRRAPPHARPKAIRRDPAPCAQALARRARDGSERAARPRARARRALARAGDRARGPARAPQRAPPGDRAPPRRARTRRRRSPRCRCSPRGRSRSEVERGELERAADRRARRRCPTRPTRAPPTADTVLREVGEPRVIDGRATTSSSPAG